MTRLRILVGGMLAAVPGQGSAAWAALQYVLGFRQLGHEVSFVETLDTTALRPSGAPLGRSDNAAYFRQVVADFGLHGTAALLLEGSDQTIGLPYSELVRAAARADLLINLSGLITESELTARIPLRVYVDLDPAFTQLWSAIEGIDMGFEGHTHFVTIGQAIGRPPCRVPTCGLSWITTPQPLVLDNWPLAGDLERDALTTIANWRGYGSIEHEGVLYGQKAHSLRRFFSLPRQTDQRFELALAIHPDEHEDLEALRANRWRLLDPLTVAETPAAARRFIQGSKAEFCIAKSGYVSSRCGWFSDRSICYLASGRPVIAQDTGFDRYLPIGEGLFSFDSAAEVLASIEELKRDYPAQQRAARAIAEEYFAARKVLGHLLERIGAAP